MQLLTKSRLLILIRHIKGILRELEKMAEEMEDAQT